MPAREKPIPLSPVRDEVSHWVYLFGAADGAIKVGMTMDPAGRMRAHRYKDGRAAEWLHWFPGMSRLSAWRTEYFAKCEFSRIGQRIGHTERFTGISKATAIAVIRRGIAERRVQEDQHEKDQERRRLEARAWAEFKAQLAPSHPLPQEKAGAEQQ